MERFPLFLSISKLIVSSVCWSHTWSLHVLVFPCERCLEWHQTSCCWVSSCCCGCFLLGSCVLLFWMQSVSTDTCVCNRTYCWELSYSEACWHPLLGYLGTEGSLCFSICNLWFLLNKHLYCVTFKAVWVEISPPVYLYFPLMLREDPDSVSSWGRCLLKQVHDLWEYLCHLFLVWWLSPQNPLSSNVLTSLGALLPLPPAEPWGSATILWRFSAERWACLPVPILPWFWKASSVQNLKNKVWSLFCVFLKLSSQVSEERSWRKCGSSFQYASVSWTRAVSRKATAGASSSDGIRSNVKCADSTCLQGL